MTVASLTNKSGPYNGNGSTSAFAVNTKYTAKAEVSVIVTSSAGVETTKTLDTHYTLTDPGDSGTATFITSPTDYRPQTGETVTIITALALTQATDLTSGGSFSSTVIEGAFDKLTRLVHQIAEKVTRAPKLRQTTTTGELTFPEPVADGILKYNAAGDDLETGVAADIDLAVVTPFIETLLDDATAAEARTTLGVVIGTDVQASDADLTEIAALATTSFGRSVLTQAAAANLATLAGVGTGDSPQFTAVNVGAATDTTIARVSAGVISVEGVTILTTATGQPLDAEITAIAALAVTDGNIIVGNGTTWVAESGATARTSLGVGTGDSPTFTGLVLSGTLTVPLIQGGTGSGDDLRLTSTSNATKGTINLGNATTGVFFDETNERLSLGGAGNTYTFAGISFGVDLFIHNDESTEICQAVARYHNTSATASACWVGLRSRGTMALPAVVQSGDRLALLSFLGHDGTDYEYGGAIYCEVDGTPGNNDMPGRIIIATTPDGAQTPVEAMRINSDQSVQFSTVARPDANDGAALGTATVSWSDLFLGSGAVINAANGDAVITHSTGVWTVSTGDLRITTAGTNAASAVTVGGTQTLTAKTLTSPTINAGALSGVFTGTFDGGGMTAFEIPNSAAPTVDADGEIAIDSTVTDFSHGVLKYFGGEEMAVIAVPIAELTSPTNGHVIAYNAANDEFELAAPAAAGSGFSSIVIQTFVASGTYTPTAGMSYCIAEVQAPGGGGGGGDSDATTGPGAGAGGGGGEYASGVFSAATVGASQTVTINAVGTAGANTGGNGGAGGSVSVGALITANGGSGGTGSGSNNTTSKVIAGAAGGTGGTGGNVRIPGGPGHGAIMLRFDNDGAGTMIRVALAGQGGSAHMGFGGGAGIADSTGATGQNYGGGGAGGADDDTTGSAGGAGGAAIIIITEYIA
jgi:hypothetical protein